VITTVPNDDIVTHEQKSSSS